MNSNEEKEMDNTVNYYYRHKKATKKVNKNYIVVSNENYETEKDMLDYYERLCKFNTEMIILPKLKNNSNYLYQ